MLSLGVFLLILALFLTASHTSWATPSQSTLQQTVPTSTPSSVPSTEPTATSDPTVTRQPTVGPTSVPTETDQATPAPTADTQPTGTPTAVPQSTATRSPTNQPTAKPEVPEPLLPSPAAPQLLLTQTSNQYAVIPGDEIIITLQMTNTGQGDLLELTVEDVLPESMLLQDVSAYGASVEVVGQHLSINIPRLGGGQVQVVILRAAISPGSSHSSVIEHQPVAIASGSVYPWPMLTLLLPPLELPATGRPGLVPCACLQPSTSTT